MIIFKDISPLTCNYTYTYNPDDNIICDFDNNTMLYIPIDMKENDNEFDVFLEIPGVKKQNIKIVIEKNNLVISGFKEDVKNSSKENFIRMERLFGKFKKIISIPENIDKDNIKAKYNDGVLQVTLPKKITKEEKTIIIDINEGGKKNEKNGKK